MILNYILTLSSQNKYEPVYFHRSNSTIKKEKYVAKNLAIKIMKVYI